MNAGKTDAISQAAEIRREIDSLLKEMNVDVENVTLLVQEYRDMKNAISLLRTPGDAQRVHVQSMYYTFLMSVLKKLYIALRSRGYSYAELTM